MLGLWICFVFTLYRYRYFWVPYNKLGITYTILKKGETPTLTREVVKAQEDLLPHAGAWRPRRPPCSHLSPPETHRCPGGGGQRLVATSFRHARTPSARPAGGGGCAQTARGHRAAPGPPGPFRGRKVPGRGHSVPCLPPAAAPGHFPGERGKAAK